MWANYGITCALNMRLEKHETTESCHDKRVAAKCFIPDGELPWDLNPSDLTHSISSAAHMCDNNLEQVNITIM